MDLVVEVKPNNLIVVGTQSLMKVQKRLGDTAATAAQTRLATHYGNAQLEIVQGYSGGAITNHYGSERYKVLHKGEVKQWQEAKSRSLDIIHEVQSKKLKEKEDAKSDTRRLGRVGFGRLPSRGTQFTRLARHRILSGGTLIARASDEPSRSTFVTLTVPGNAAWVGDNVTRWATFLANRTLQGIRNAKRRGEYCEYFYCWEYQKRGVLHMHLVIYSSEAGVSYTVGQNVVTRWHEALKSLAVSGVDVFTKRDGRSCWLPQHWQADLQPVRKSVAAYISKYVSKSESKTSSTDSGSASSSGVFQPGRWWGMSRNLVRQITRYTSRVVVEGLSENICTAIATRIAEKLLKSKGLLRQNQYVFDITHGENHVGSGFRFLFYLCNDSYDYFRNLGIGVCADLCHFDADGINVSGNNWLYRQAKGLSDIAPSYALTGL